MKEIKKIARESGSKMRKNVVDKSKMRKIEKCANSVEVTIFLELEGYDIKTLNSTVGKGSYMLKAGERTLTVPYTSSGKKAERKVTLNLYKFKGLRGFFRRAAEARLLKLKEEGKVATGPCTPTTNYPHEEILEQHQEMGYHLQGTCTPMCLVRRLFGSLDYGSSLKIFPPYIAKANTENLPAKVNQYLDENIEAIFGIDHCIVYHNGESTLKTETFNIINRGTELAVNNFMKHTANGIFPFKMVASGTPKELLENIGFFMASLNEINRNNGIQLGADKNNGSGRVTINVKDFKVDHKFPEVEKLVRTEKKRVHVIKVGDLALQEVETNYYLDFKFGQFALDIFNKMVGK